MTYSYRDHSIREAVSRQPKYAYGMGVGIILLDETYPGFPGDVRNASAYPFPIQYEVATGIDIQALVYAEDKSGCLEPIVAAAQKLEKLGCRAIAAECGYFARFQRQIAAAVDVPVFMSSLLQVPWAQQLIGPDKVVGLLMAVEAELEDTHLESVGVVPGSNFVIGGAMDEGACPEFHCLWSEGVRPDPPRADYQKAEADFVAAGVAFYERHPNMGAMVLECTGFPPFARRLQQAIDIPLFSWGTLLDFAFSVSVHRDYYGHI